MTSTMLILATLFLLAAAAIDIKRRKYVARMDRYEKDRRANTKAQDEMVGSEPDPLIATFAYVHVAIDEEMSHTKKQIILCSILTIILAIVATALAVGSAIA